MNLNPLRRFFTRCGLHTVTYQLCEETWPALTCLQAGPHGRALRLPRNVSQAPKRLLSKEAADRYFDIGRIR